MKRFNQTLTIIASILSLYGCSSSENTSVNSISKSNSSCPKCNMHIIDSKEYSSNLEKYDFDDIGCMVLYSKENNIDLNKIDSKVFTIDTKRFVDSKEAYYTIDEKTPMSYGFGAYENQVKNSITFNDMILRMLRGENLTNPKIRKQLLGDKI